MAAPQSMVPQTPEGAPGLTNPRLEALAGKKAILEATLAQLQAERSELVAQAKQPADSVTLGTSADETRTKAALDSANAVIKNHIVLLHEYNEIKDIGQGLMGLIADERGVRVAAVMEEFGMDEKD